MFDMFLHYVLPFVAVIDLIVFIHAAGHLIGCRLFSVEVESVSFGVGPVLWCFTKGGVVWRICWVPVGGCVHTRLQDYNGGACSKYIFVAMSGTVMNVLFAIITIFLIFSITGVSAVQDGVVLLVQQPVLADFLAAMRMTALTWVTWNTHTVTSIASVFGNEWLRLTFLSAVWSSQLGILNLLPFPALDGWRIARICFVRFFGIERGRMALKWLLRGIIFLVVLVIVYATYNDLVHLGVVEKIRMLFV